MTDDDPFGAAKPDQRDTDILRYDFSKHLLTLTLLVLGGVLSLVQGPEAEKIPKNALLMIVVVLAISGVSSLSSLVEIVRAHIADRPVRRRESYYNQIAMLTLGMGVAIFLTVWLDLLR